MIKAHNLIDIKTKPRHPESNGIVERFNGTVREDTGDEYGNNYLQAETIIGKSMSRYDDERLHAALGYMTPATWHRAIPTKFEKCVHGELLLPVRIAKTINQQQQGPPR